MAKKSKASTPTKATLLPVERIESRIVLLRDQKVMLDADLAELYGVSTRALNQAVRRNADRFPDDFMFQLSAAEADNLRSQSVISSYGGRRYLPYAFTEQGVAMLSSVLRSDQAVRVNIAIMRAFVRLRQVLATHAELARKLQELEQKSDRNFAAVFRAIEQLIQQDAAEPSPYGPKKKRIGYQ